MQRLSMGGLWSPKLCSPHGRALALVLGVGLALRLALVAYVAPYPERYLQTDAIGYHQLAQNLVQGHGFSRDSAPPYRPDNFRTPIYPLTLAAVYRLFDREPVAMLFLQALMGTLTVLGVYLMARRLIAPRAGLLAAALLALSPHSILYTALLWSDTEYTLLLTGSIFLGMVMLARPEPKWALASGLALGLATLTHPRSLYLPLLFVVAWSAARLRQGAPRRQIVGHAVLYLLAFQMVLLPWRLRNLARFGVPNLTSAPGINMLYYGAALAKALETGEDHWSVAQRYDAQLREQGAFRWNEAEFADRALRLALDEIGKRPWNYARVHLLGTAKVFLPGVFAVNTVLTGETQIDTSAIYGMLITAPSQWRSLMTALETFPPTFWAYMAFTVPYLALVYGLALRTLLAHLRRPSWPWLFGGIVLYLAGVAGPAGAPRFRVAIMPLLCVLASHSLVALWPLRGHGKAGPPPGGP